jgi:hypothetical protein
MMDPELGEWFPEHALQLARAANPPLYEKGPAKLVDGAGDAEEILTRPGPSVGAPTADAEGGANAKRAAHAMAETDEHALAIEHPSRHRAARRFATNTVNGEAPVPPPDNLRQAADHRPAPTFDPDNPYR